MFDTGGFEERRAGPQTEGAELQDAAPQEAVEAVAKLDDDALEREISVLAGHLYAGTGRWLVLIGEFDRRRRWAEWGCKSAVQWLSWKCGLAPRAARDHVRVGRRLLELPRIRAEFCAGRLSYSAARAITRVATVDNEDELINLALYMTADDLERTVRAYRSAQRQGEVHEAQGAHALRYLTYHYDESGSLVLNARLPGDEGAIVVAALEDALKSLEDEAGTAEGLDQRGRDEIEDNTVAADVVASDKDQVASANHAGAPAKNGSAEPLFGDAEAAEFGGDGSSQEAYGPPEGTEASVRGPTEDETDDKQHAYEPVVSEVRPADAHRLSPAPLRAVDALVAMAETVLDSGLRSCPGPQRTQVVVHVDLDTLTLGRDGRCEIEGGPALAPETARRLGCDASVIALLEKDGKPLHAGRKKRFPSTPLRRAVIARDRTCRWPGCNNHRYVQIHHEEHWGHGGETFPENLHPYCPFHHRLLHEGGYRIEHHADGTATVYRPDGKPLPGIPLWERCDDYSIKQTADYLERDADEVTFACEWDGHHPDYRYIVDVLTQPTVYLDEHAATREPAPTG